MKCTRRICKNEGWGGIVDFFPIKVTYGYGSRRDGEEDRFCSDECLKRHFMSLKIYEIQNRNPEVAAHTKKLVRDRARVWRKTPEGKAYGRAYGKKRRAERCKHESQ